MSPVDAGDLAALDRVRRLCLAYDDVEEATLQDRPHFRVGRRRFAIVNGAASPARRRWLHAGRSLHFLADPSERDALLADPRLGRSPHHGDRGWLALPLDAATTDWVEVAELLDAAHAQVARRG